MWKLDTFVGVVIVVVACFQRPEGHGTNRQYIVFRLHHSRHCMNEYFAINPVPFSHIPAYIRNGRVL